MNTTQLQRRRHRMANVVLAALLFLLMSLASVAEVTRRSDTALIQSPDRVALTGHVLPALAQATAHVAKAATLHGDEPLTLTIVLNRSDPDGFAAYLADVYDSASPNFRNFLTPTQVSDRFGPHRPDYEVVKNYFLAHGFRIGEASANRLTVTIRGRRSNVARALATDVDCQSIRRRFPYPKTMREEIVFDRLIILVVRPKSIRHLRRR